VADTVVGPAKPGLEIAKDAMDVQQELAARSGGALRARAMAVAEFRERSIGLPPVRQDEGTGDHGPLHEACQRTRRSIQDHLEPHPASDARLYRTPLVKPLPSCHLAVNHDGMAREPPAARPDHLTPPKEKCREVKILARARGGRANLAHSLLFSTPRRPLSDKSKPPMRVGRKASGQGNRRPDGRATEERAR
jgi:hypothetical protein